MNNRIPEGQTGFEPLFFHIQAILVRQRPFWAADCSKNRANFIEIVAQSFGCQIVGLYKPTIWRPFSFSGERMIIELKDEEIKKGAAVWMQNGGALFASQEEC